MRIVKREEPRRNLLQRDAAVWAGIVLREGELLAAFVQLGRQEPSGQTQRRFCRVRQTAAGAFPQGNTVHYDLNIVLFILIQRNLFPQIIHQAVHPRPHIAGAPGILQHLAVLALFPADHRRQQRNTRPLGKRHQPVHHLIDGLLLNLPAAVRAVGNPDTGIQKAKVVIDFRHRTHSGAGVFGGRFLVDGNRWGKTVNGVNIRLVHLTQEHPGIGTQTLNIAPLPFGIHGVEGEAGLPASGKPCHNSEFVPGNHDVNVL